jgi:hypothetical protein
MAIVTMLDPIKFIRGMNQKPDPELGDWQELTNVDCSRVGIAKATKINSTERTPSSSAVHSLCYGYVSTQEVVLDGAGTSIYRDGVSVKTGLSGQKLSTVSQNSRVYVTNPIDGLWMYNTPGSGGVMYRAGAPVPSTACVPATSGAGTTGFTGTYYVVTTFVNANGYESNPSTEASVTMAGGNLLNITDIPINSDLDYNIPKRRIYIQGGTTPLYTEYVLLATIEDNMTTSLSDLSSADVDTLTVLEEDNYLPPYMKSIVSHYDTFMGIGVTGYENYLYYSKTGKGEQWPPTQAIKISGSGDYPRGLVVWDSVLWVGTPSRIYQLIGSPGSGTLSTNFYLKESRTKKGFATSNGNVPTPYGLFYMAEDGIFKFDGAASDHVSHTLQNYLDRINISAIDATCGCYFDNKLFFSFPIDSSTVNSITVIYDFETDQWMTHDVGYAAFYPDYVNNDLYVAHGTVVEKYRGGSTYAEWTIKTKDLNDGPGQYTSWNEYEVDMDGACTCNVYFDDTLVVTEIFSTSGREVLTRTFPNQMARRCSIELVGSAKSTQDKIYSIRVSEEKIGERGEP